MKFNQQPAGYLPASGPLTYGLSGCDPAQVVQVGVTDQGSRQTTGLKRLAGESSYLFDVSGYTCWLPVVEPYVAGAGLVEAGGRMARVDVYTEELDGGTLCLTAGRREAQALQRLSDAPAVRRLDWGGWDEIAFIASGVRISAGFIFFKTDGEEVAKWDLLDVEHGMVVLPVHPLSLREFLIEEGYRPEDFDRFKAVVATGGKRFAECEYRLAEQNPAAVHLAWVNDLGGVDHYAFPGVDKQAVAVERIAGDPCGVRARRVVQAVSDYEPAAALEWLAALVASRQVWRMYAGKAVPVEVLSTEAVTGGEGPGRVKVSFAEMLNEELFSAL